MAAEVTMWPVRLFTPLKRATRWEIVVIVKRSDTHISSIVKTSYCFV